MKSTDVGKDLSSPTNVMFCTDQLLNQEASLGAFYAVSKFVILDVDS